MQLSNPNGIIHLSINPWYFCNLRCEFCYLTEAQLSDRKLLDLQDLDQRLTEVTASGHRLGHADIYGGEVMLLPKGYMQDLKKLLHAHGITEIEVITNLTALHPDVVNDPDFGISISYDFECRERHEEVWQNLMRLERPFTILTLATPEVMKLDVHAMVMEMTFLRNLMAWEIKPYSASQANAAPMSHRAFESFVQAVIEASEGMSYEVLNEKMIDEAANGQRNSFSDDHVYITPSGKFGVLEFDLNNNEFFQELDSFEAYLEWCLIEKGRVYENGVCGGCEFLGKCLSEHLRKVDSLEDSCNGYYHLIKWGQTRYA